MNTLDNYRILLLLSEHILSQYDMLFLMKMRCSKMMKKNIEMICSVTTTENSIDVKTSTKKHLRLFKNRYNITRANIHWRINPQDDNNLLLIEKWINYGISTTITGTITVQEEDDKRVITASMDTTYNSRFIHSDITLNKITDDMYLQAEHVIMTCYRGNNKTKMCYVLVINSHVMRVDGDRDRLEVSCNNHLLSYTMNDRTLITEDEYDGRDSDDSDEEEDISPWMNIAATITFNYLRSQPVMNEVDVIDEDVIDEE